MVFTFLRQLKTQFGLAIILSLRNGLVFVLSIFLIWSQVGHVVKSLQLHLKSLNAVKSLKPRRKKKGRIKREKQERKNI